MMITGRILTIAFFVLVVLVSTLDASKRTIKQKDRRKHKKAKLNNSASVPPKPYEPSWNLPVELFMEVCQYYINDLRTRRTLENPMTQLFLVSKSWNHQMHKEDFRKFLLKQPKYALLLLKIHFSLDTQYHLDLLQVAKLIIEIEAAIKLLLKAKTVDQVKMLCDVPAFKEDMTETTYNQYLTYAHRHKYFGKIFPKNIHREATFRHPHTRSYLMPVVIHFQPNRVHMGSNHFFACVVDRSFEYPRSYCGRQAGLQAEYTELSFREPEVKESDNTVIDLCRSSPKRKKS